MNEKEYKAICKKYRKRLTLVGAEHIGEMEHIEVPQSLHTDEEIAKSFIEDVEAVEDQLEG